MTQKNNSGFTLIELLVVIAIIGILSSVVLANLNSARQKARDAKRIADVKSLQLALALYFDATNGKYPGTLGSDGATAGAELAPTYISFIPKDPSTNGSYKYVPLNIGGGICNGYHLGAALELGGNSVLTNDSDESGGTVPTSLCGIAGTIQAPSGSVDFNGTSAACNGTAGTPQPNGTEQCFDVTP